MAVNQLYHLWTWVNNNSSI